MRRALLLFVVLGLSVSATAKDSPTQPINWPANNPILQFVVDKVTKVGSYGGRQTWMIEVSVKNLSAKRISAARFDLYLVDKQQVRIGEGYLDISNVGPNETIKMNVNADTAGIPASFTVAPKQLPPELGTLGPPKTVGITIYSVPSGATLVVDGKAVGTTPVVVKVLPGSHNLIFTKEGYNSGNYPLVVHEDEIAGGTVTFELGVSGHDTVELRDGSVLTGDLQSIDATQVVIRIGGNDQKIARNMVKRVLLVEREQPK
jgi:hypothetical protein